MTPEDREKAQGRDMEPLAERPGYNANPTDWVRYANHLEARLAALSPAALAAEPKPVEIEAERDRYWQALVDIAGWERWQAASGPTWREIAEAALSEARTEGQHDG